MKIFAIFILCSTYCLTESAKNKCVSTVRGQCGGKIGRQCCTPLTCIYGDNSTQPNFPDQGGLCSNCHGLGTMCAGFAGFQCCPGLQCVIANPDPQMSDQAGTCVRPTPCQTPTDRPGCRAKGQMCGGIAGFMCCSGLKCKLEGNFPDASGTCI